MSLKTNFSLIRSGEIIHVKLIDYFNISIFIIFQDLGAGENTVFITVIVPPITNSFIKNPSHN